MFKEGLQLSYSLICSGSEPFIPKEQLLSVEGDIFLITRGLIWGLEVTIQIGEIIGA